MVALIAIVPARVFTALSVISVDPKGNTQLAAQVTGGVAADLNYLPLNRSTNSSGPSDAVIMNCITGDGFRTGQEVMPDAVGNWTYMYFIQYYFPENANYTYDDDRICLNKPMTGMYQTFRLISSIRIPFHSFRCSSGP
jgi:hypothetical protein